MPSPPLLDTVRSIGLDYSRSQSNYIHFFLKSEYMLTLFFLLGRKTNECLPLP